MPKLVALLACVCMLVAMTHCRPLTGRSLADSSDSASSELDGPSSASTNATSPRPVPTKIVIKLGNSTLWTLPPLPSTGEWLTSVDLKDQIQKFKLAGSGDDSGSTNAGAAAALGGAEEGTADPNADAQPPPSPSPSPSPANPFIDPGNSDKPLVNPFENPTNDAAIITIVAEVTPPSPSPVPVPPPVEVVPPPVEVVLPPPPAPVFSGNCPDPQATLDFVNSFRAVYHSGPLAWNNDLANSAQAWANTCARDHSPNAGMLGECLMMGMGDGLLGGCLESVMGWAAEAPLYDFSGNFIHDAGHFTAMVWAGVAQIGCGFQVCPGGNFGVCHFNPPGNVVGQFNQNVFRP